MHLKINGNGIAGRTNKKGHNMPQKYHFRAITDPGTKEELMFATKTLGRQDEDWAWMKKRALKYGKQKILQFTVGIRKEEFDRIEKKYDAFSYGKKALV